MQRYADIYLLLNYSTCFGRLWRTSSGVHKTVVTASCTDHTIWGASFFKREQIKTGLGQSVWSTIKKDWTQNIRFHYYNPHMEDAKRTREFNTTAKRHCMSQCGSRDLFLIVKTTLWVSDGLITSMHVASVQLNPLYWG